MIASLLMLLASPQNTVIYVDNREVCGFGGRVSAYQQGKADAKARRIAAQIRKDGGKARIVRLHPGMRINSEKYEAPVLVPVC